MRKLSMLLLSAFLIPAQLMAQAPDAVPRVEIGLQGDIAEVGPIGQVGGGGFRFHYNFANHYAFDTSVTYRQHDASPSNNFLLPPVALGQTNALFGLRAGFREENAGAFFRARAGFLHFAAVNGADVISRRTVPAFDAGITVEHYHGPMILRADLGELIIPFGNATISSGFPPTSARLGTRVTFLLGLGIAVRFGSRH